MKVGGSRGQATTGDFAARMNVQMKNGKMSQDIVLQNFRKTFTLDSSKGQTEHLIAVDNDGFTYALNHGGSSAVGYKQNEVNGKLVIHNHPNDTIFSRQDLRNVSGTQGIVASGKSGDHIFKLTKNFDNDGFQKALTRSPLSNSTSAKAGETSTEQVMARYNAESSKWLKRNAKKYGFTYTYNKA